MSMNGEKYAGQEPSIQSMESVAALLESGEGAERLRIYDVNQTRRYERHHVPGAVHLDPGRYQMSDLPLDKRESLLFYCLEPRCSAAWTAAKRALEMGYVQVAYMPEGIEGWLGAGLPVEPGMEQE
jgi:rhodanese-related sulfurtransferase